jgi:hypothetical protein
MYRFLSYFFVLPALQKIRTSGLSMEMGQVLICAVFTAGADIFTKTSPLYHIFINICILSAPPSFILELGTQSRHFSMNVWGFEPYNLSGYKC